MDIYMIGNLYIAIEEVDGKIISGQGSTRDLAVEDLNKRLGIKGEK